MQDTWVGVRDLALYTRLGILGFTDLGVQGSPDDIQLGQSAIQTEDVCS